MILSIELDTIEQVPDVVEAFELFATYCRSNGSEGVGEAMNRIVDQIHEQYPEYVVV